MVAKILAILAAALLVGAVAVGTLAPQEMTLREALTAIDAGRFGAIESYVRNHLSAWLWDHPMMSLLIRPVWLLPACAGLLLAGSAMTVANSAKAPNSRRRRS